MVWLDYWHQLLDLLPSRRLKKEKQKLRNYLLQKRRILTEEEIAVCSEEVVKQIMEDPNFQSAKRVMLYYPVKHEIDLRALFTLAPDKEYYLPIAHTKRMSIKRYTGEDNMHKGKYHIPEPIGDDYRGPLDLILVPGVAFDKEHYRLGRGAGYYDRFLEKFSKVWKIGIGYAFQYKSHIPVGKHDMKVDHLIFSKTK